jgi:hypothetical protein
MNEAALIDRAKAALAQLGLKVVEQKAPRGAPARIADAWWRIARGKTACTVYLVEAKRAVTRATLGAVVEQLRARAATIRMRTLLVTDYLTPQVAEALRDRKQEFADAAGNAYLDGPNVFVYVVGQKAKERRTVPKLGRLFTPNGIKILFALLCQPTLAQGTHREMAATAGVALGAVPPTLAALQAEGHLIHVGQRRRLNMTKRLLDEWALAYARRLREKTLEANYTTENFDTWRTWQLGTGARWGGEPAGALLTEHLRPGVLTLYVDRVPPRLLLEQRMKRIDRPADQRMLEVRRPFWGKALTMPAEHNIVPPILVYADLLATGDGRCFETAEMIYDGHLARLFQPA